MPYFKPFYLNFSDRLQSFLLIKPGLYFESNVEDAHSEGWNRCNSIQLTTVMLELNAIEKDSPKTQNRHA
jgi:hypothetical protein